VYNSTFTYNLHLWLSPLRPLVYNWELVYHYFVCPSVQFPFAPFHHSSERDKRGFNCDKQEWRAVTVLNHMLKGLWKEGGNGGIRKKLKYKAQLICNIKIDIMISCSKVQSRSTLHSVSEMSTFTYCNKLTSKIVSKPLMGLTTLNQALIHTPTPNLIGVIWSDSMISQAFQACYSIEGCLSDYCILSQERIGYRIGKIHQLNLSPRLSLIHSRELHLKPQELLRWRQGPRRLLPSISTLRNILEYYKC